MQQILFHFHLFLIHQILFSDFLHLLNKNIDFHTHQINSDSANIIFCKYEDI